MRRCRFVYNSRRAVTLVEMLIACAILAIGLVGTVRVVTMARGTQSESYALARLALRANAELETWRTRPFDSLKPGTTPVTDIDDALTTGVVTVQPFRDTSLCEITVTLQRATPKGTRRVIFTTLRAKESVQ